MDGGLEGEVTINAPSGVAMIEDGRIASPDPGFCEIVGLDAEAVVGLAPERLLDRLGVRALPPRGALERAGRWQSRMWARPAAEAVPLEVLWFLPGGGREILMLRDLTEPFDIQQRAASSRLRDTVTGLPNREVVLDRLAQQIAASSRTGLPVGVLYVDLEDFSACNEAHGSAVGDRLLREAGQRLASGLRPDDTVGRIGDDEFCVLMNRLAEPEDAQDVASRLLASLQTPFLIGGEQIALGASGGVALAPADAKEASRLVDRARAAMREAATGMDGERVKFFRPEMNRRVAERLALRARLARCFEQPGGEDGFRFVYQPKARLDDGEPSGFEALVRWRDQGRDVPPPLFLAAIEDGGLLADFTALTLDLVRCQAVAWRAQGIDDARIAINLSPAQLKNPATLAAIGAAVRDMPWLATSIEIEVTESSVFDDAGAAVHLLNAVRGLGIRIALDDFGTGYSSLATLARLPIDVLKVDRAFVKDVDADPRRTGMLQAIVAIARNCDCDIVAEGIETPAERDIARAVGCDLEQGFLLSRPLEADAAERWWRERAPGRRR